MAPARLKRFLASCAVGAACGLAAAGCGEEPGLEEAAREGLAIDVGGIDYNVFLTRQLNLEITPDEAFYKGPPAKPGHVLLAVFIQACNLASDKPEPATDDFVIEDNQGMRFKPLELPEENDFAYHPAELPKEECIPEDGSVAQQGATGGSMLLFDLPLDTTYNRPLELTITPAEGEEEPKRIELDL